MGSVQISLKISFSSQKEKETFENTCRFEAAKVLLVPGVKRNATVSLLNALLDRVLTQSESVPASRVSSSGNEIMLDSAGSLDTIVCVVQKI